MYSIINNISAFSHLINITGQKKMKDAHWTEYILKFRENFKVIEMIRFLLCEANKIFMICVHISQFNFN